MLKAELSFSLEASVAVADDTKLNHLLSNAQQRLSTGWDWPFKETRSDVALVAGTKLYTLPSLVFERPVEVATRWPTTGVWTPVEYGVGVEEYNVWNSDDGDRSDPAQRWRFNSGTQFEIWPIPSDAQTLRFTGQAALSTLLSGGNFDDAKTLDLDDILVVYFAAYGIAARRKFQDAPLMLRNALERLAEVRASYPRRYQVAIIGSDAMQREQKRLAKLVLVP